MSDHSGLCWALHHECALRKIVELQVEVDALEHERVRWSLGVGKIPAVPGGIDHWETACDHLGCRILRLKRFFVRGGGRDEKAIA